MKRNRINILIGIVLVAAACYFIFRNNFSTVRTEDRNFAIEDTASVTRIFLADKNNNAVTLDRKSPSEWIVNGKYETRLQGVTLILDCLKKIRVRTRVPRNSFNTVIRELSSTGIKMEVYTNGNNEKPFKVYYIGGSTMDVLGTYMMLENSTVPFVTEVPGFNGYLTPRFSPVERDWLIPEIFDLTQDQIKSVSLNYSLQPQESFTIERAGNTFKVFSPVTNIPVVHPDTLRINMYLHGFKDLNFETWDRHLNEHQQDSLLHEPPVTVLTLVEMNGKKTVIPMYPKPVTAASLAQTDSLGKDLKYDVDRMYAFLNDGKELVTVQYFVFKKIFASLRDFDMDRPKR